MFNIKVVDDHPASRLFLKEILKAEGYTANDSADAVAALRETEENPADIWFVDWVMPGMTGIELVRSIRARTGGDQPYVIMLTSKGSEEDLATAFEAGVDDFIAKPIGVLELRSRLRAATRLAGLHKGLQSRITEINRLNDELLRINSRLEVMASTDALTGLLNRRAGLQRLVETWEQSQSFGRPLSVAIVDVDQFKRVNDVFGHARGDAALRYVSSVLSDGLRDDDAVCRLGGEEFLVIFPNTDIGMATQCMTRCRERIERAKCTADGQEMPLAISAGVASRSGSTNTVEELLRVADKALFQAKEGGRNRVVQSATTR